MKLLVKVGRYVLSELSNYYNVDINRKALHCKEECVDVYLVLNGYKFIFKVSCYINRFFLYCLDLSSKEVLDFSSSYYKGNCLLSEGTYINIMSDLVIVARNYIDLNKK